MADLVKSKIEVKSDAGLLVSPICPASCKRRLAKEYLYFNVQLIAMIDYSGVTNGGAGQIYYAHNDHLGTPKLLTNSAGKPVWQASYTPFGLATINADVDNNGVAVTLNIRFPGQYYDAESGLHYNWFRYYDPVIGRYVTSDPIGLAGGMNTYGYVGGNPVGFVDPRGLKAWVNVFPSKAGGYVFIAHDEHGSTLITGRFNRDTINYNQIGPGTYKVEPRPRLPNTLSNWFSNRNENAGNPTISNTNDWNKIQYSNGNVTRGAQFHEGRDGTSSGISQACMVSDCKTNDALNQLFKLNHDNGGTVLTVYPKDFQGL